MDGYAVERQPDMLEYAISRTILSALLIKPRYAIANGKGAAYWKSEHV